MDPVSIGQLARELGGEVRGADAQVQGAVIDSRRTGEGDLFVALAGSRVDGHDYLAQAREAGAAAAMVERWLEDALPQWRVDNARQTLARLGTLARERSRAKIVGITGSNGKTTVKEMIAAIAGRCGETLATQGNLNNELGVPLTLCRLDSSHRYAVVEMGCSRPGDIATLAGWTRPDIGLVTNAGPAHLEGLGDLDGVARTKGELFQELPADGVAVINADDRYAEFWMELAGDRRRLTFGMADAGADVHGEAADGDRLLVRLPDGTRLEVTLPLPGAHNRLNALAAAAVGYALGAPAKAIREGLEALRPTAGRLRRLPALAGAVVIDDAYNANPGSLRAGLEVLAEHSGERWLALGDMGELGTRSRALHEEAGRLAKSLGVDRLFACGELAGAAAHAFGEGARVFADQKEMIGAIRNDLHEGVVLLVKGSRSAAMDAVVNALAKENKNEAGS